MEPEIRSFLTLSTAHITKRTSDRLTKCNYNYGNYGHFVYVGGPHWDMPGDLLEVSNYARACGCQYVLFDRDGDTIDKLPTYEW